MSRHLLEISPNRVVYSAQVSLKNLYLRYIHATTQPSILPSILPSVISSLSFSSPGSNTALSIVAGKPLCLPRIITAQRISLLALLHPPLKLSVLPPGNPVLNPTGPYADTTSNITLKIENVTGSLAKPGDSIHTMRKVDSVIHQRSCASWMRSCC